MIQFTKNTWQKVVEILRRVVPAARVLSRFTPTKLDDVAVEVLDQAISVDVQVKVTNVPPAKSD